MDMHTPLYVFSVIGSDGSEVKVRFSAENLDFIIEKFELFLKGAGFSFENHMIDLVEKDLRYENGDEYTDEEVSENVKTWFESSPVFYSYKTERTTKNAE